MLLRDNIYQAIRSAILSCEFQPGQELREQILAERFHVSRSPIRDSLLRLEHENLVTVLPRQGYRVNAISIADVEDIVGLRKLIEPACAAAAATRDDATVMTLDRFRDFVDDGTIDADFMAYNRAFHRAVAEMSGNARMATVAADLMDQFERLVRSCVQHPIHWRFERALGEHVAIIDAIQAHDAALASRLASQHMEAGRTRLIEALNQSEPLTA